MGTIIAKGAKITAKECMRSTFWHAVAGGNIMF
jgi:hypothetical protein